MIAFVCLFVNALLLILSYNRYRSFFAPPVLLNLLWGVSNFMNLILGWNSNNLTYIILLLPSLAFTIGFWISTTGMRQTFNLDFDNPSFVFKESALNWLFFFNCIFSAIYFYFIIRNIIVYYTGNLWYTLRLITWMENTNIAIFKYPTIPIFIFPSLCILQYRFTHKGILRIVVSVILAMIWGFFSSSRTPIATFIVVTLFSYLLFSPQTQKKKEKRKQIKIFFGAFVVILVSFVYVAFQKNADTYGNVSSIEFVFKSLINYSNLSSASFVEWYEGGFEYTNGSATFRFVFAVLSRFGFDVEVANTSSGGLFIAYENFTTNALTVARNYVQDYGVLFMTGMLLMFGIVHGYFYDQAMTRIDKRKIKGVIFSAALYLPLLFQILTDQYMNCFSQWLQYFLWLTLFSSSIFVNKMEKI